MQSARHAEHKAAGAVMATAALCCLLACLCAGCRRADEGAASPADTPRTEAFSHGAIRVELTFSAAQVDVRRDLLLTIAIAAPSEVDVRIPPIGNRLQGFLLNGEYEDEPVERGGKVFRARHYRLAPLLNEEYRLAPMAIEYTDTSRSPAEAGWFPTQPVVLESRPLVEGEPPDDISVDLSPVWVYPASATIAAYVFLVLLAVGLVVLVVFLLKHLRRTAAQRRLSARERALRELSVLIAKDLVGRDLTKDFYVELTMIVRRYIERAHAVRAPEQTTEEFLVAVSNDRRFPGAVVERLKAFLQAADLVKFAAYRPDRPAVDDAVRTARVYIETDSEEAEGED